MKPVRWSNLKHMHRSPAHYRYAIENPPEATAAMRVGGLAHKKLLHGPGAFAVYPGRRAGKEWEAFQAERPGVEILNSTEAAHVDGIVASVKAHPEAMRILADEAADVERHHRWLVAGRQCSGTPDVCGPWLADLKVTNDASPDRLPWQARRMLWTAQLAWYRYGLDSCDDGQVYLVAVESKPPYPVVVYRLTDEALEVGERTWRALFERLLVCEQSDTWPGYTDAVVDLDATPDDFSVTIDGEEVEL